MILQGGKYVVMGLFDPDSIAYAIGQAIIQQGGQVVYTMLNQTMKELFLDRSPKLTAEQKQTVSSILSLGGAAVGVGNVAGNFLAGALRNPSAAAGQTATLFIGIAFAEALGIFAFLVALLLMFAV